MAGSEVWGMRSLVGEEEGGESPLCDVDGEVKIDTGKRRSSLL